jgi:hypothetical protein
MGSDFSITASEELRLDPLSLFYWHQLTTAGIADQNPLLMHHGIAGSLIFGAEHEVTIDLLSRVLQTLPKDSPWSHSVIMTMQTLDPKRLAAFMPVWVELRLLESQGGISGMTPLSVAPLDVIKRIRVSNLEDTVAVLCIYTLLDGPPPGTPLMQDLIEEFVRSDRFASGTTHTLSVSAHRCLAALIDKYAFTLSCKTVVHTGTEDALALFNRYIFPVNYLSTEETFAWISRHLDLLDCEKPNEYFQAFLIAGCYYAVSYVEPDQRALSLTELVRGDLRLFNVAPLTSRFLLRSAPPSLANQFLECIKDEEQSVGRNTLIPNQLLSGVDFVASYERSFLRALLANESDPILPVEFSTIYPFLIDIKKSEVAASREQYVQGGRFAVAIFGQTRQTSFRTISENLDFCTSRMGDRLSFCSLSSWEKVSLARHPKVIHELISLFADSESHRLIEKAAAQVPVETLYQLLLDHERIEKENLDLLDILQRLCPDSKNMKINSLEEEEVEKRFQVVYPIADVGLLDDVSKKILLNQFKMWNTIAAAINSYIESGCEDPLILHRADIISTERVLDFIDSSKIFQKQNISLLADHCHASFVIPPIGGLGDRFWIMSPAVAKAIHSLLINLSNIPLVNLLGPWRQIQDLSFTFKASLMEHHRLCDILFTLFSPSIYTVSAQYGLTNSESLFNISHEELSLLLEEKGLVGQE